MKPADFAYVTIILLFAAGLRFLGVTYGQPEAEFSRSSVPKQMLPLETPMQPDEFLFVALPLEMVVRGRLNPKFFDTPSFLINLNFATFWATGAANGIQHADREGKNNRQYAPFHLYVIGRVYSALGGIAAVAATYAFSRQIGGRRAACAAGLLVAVSFTLVQHAHYATTSSLATGFTAVCIWASFRSLRSTRKPWWMFVLAGAAAGFAAGNRYNAAFVAVIVVVTGLILLYRQCSRPLLMKIAVGWAAVPAAFVLSMPQIIFDFETVWHDIGYIVGQYTAGVNVPFPITPEQGLLLEYRYLVLFSLGIPAGIMALFGVIAAWNHRSRAYNLFRSNSPALLVLLLVVYIMVYSFINLRTVRPGLADQILLPIIPAWAAIAGFGIQWIPRQQSFNSRFVFPVLVVLVAISPLTSSVQLVRQLALPDTRQIMQRWIHEHIPAGSRIQLNGPLNVPLDPLDYPWSQNYAYDLISIEQIRSNSIDFIIVSDAWYHDMARSWEITPPEYLSELRDYLEILDRSLTKAAWIDRPSWAGYNWLTHSASYFHNPGLTVYCVNKTCTALTKTTTP